MVNDFDANPHKTQPSIFLVFQFLKPAFCHHLYHSDTVATFHIVHGRQPNDVYLEDKSEPSSELMKLVYGSTVKLCHCASGKYLAVSDQNEVCLEEDQNHSSFFFRIVPPHREKGWGESLMINDSIKLESISLKGTEISFCHSPTENCYRPSLAGDGTVFSIEPYCHEHRLLNPQTIKGGSIIMIAGIEVDGYLSVKDSFVSDKLPEELAGLQKEVNLRKWRKGFFTTQPFSGDTFFQLDKTDGKFKGEKFAFGDKCQIKHLLTQQYISSSTDGKIVVQKSQGEIFDIVPVGNNDKKELQSLDQVMFQQSVDKKPDQHKYLFYDVKVTETRSQLSLFLGEKKTIFKLIKVDDDAVSDIYKVMGMSSSLMKIVPDDKTKLNDDNCKTVLELMEGLQSSFNHSLHKTRVANMLRTLKVIDIMILLLELIAASDLDKKHEACRGICNSLLLYVKNGSMKSLSYFAKQELHLNTLTKMAGRDFGAEKVLATFFACYQQTDDELLQKFLIPLVEKLRLRSLEEEHILGLLSTSAFNKRCVNWPIQEKTMKKIFEMWDMFPDVRQIIDYFVKNGKYIESCKFSADLCSTCVKVDGNDLLFYIAAAETYDDISIQQFIQAIEMTKNHYALLVQVLVALSFFINFDTLSDAKEVTVILTQILSGKDFFDSYDADFSEINSMALLCLILLFRWNLNASIKKLCHDFNYLRIDKVSHKDRINLSSEHSAGLELVVVQGGSEPSLDPQTLPPPVLTDLLNDDKVTKQLVNKSQARLSWYCKHNSVFDGIHQPLCDILMGLVDDPNDDIQLKSIELLYSIYSVEETILTECTERVYFTYSNEEIHSDMQQLATMTDKDQLIRRMLNGELTSQHAKKDVQLFVSKFDELSKACGLEEDETEPNITNQEVAYSCGLFDVILDCVLEPKILTNPETHKTILDSCFNLLQKIARRNERAQNKLFISLYDFLEMENAILPMICLLNEMFSDNCNLCKKLSEFDIDHIFHIAITSSNVKHYELTVTLRIIIENTPLATPLQEYIAQIIDDHCRGSTLKHLLSIDAKNDRKKLLEGSPCNDLQLLFKVSDLLASCATGECQHAESISSQIYSLNELLEILANRKIEDHQKLPFIRVLTWTYLFTERDSASDCSELTSDINSYFWTLMGSFNNLIKDLLDRIKRIRNEKTITQLKLMKNSFWSIYLLTINKDEDFSELYGKILFVIDGVIPLVSGFCREMSLHSYGTQMKRDQQETLKRLGENLMKFNGSTNSITEQLQYFEFFKNLNELLKQNKQNSGINELPPSTSDSKHQPEVQLNDQFQSFIKKYFQAYSVNESLDDMQKSLSIPKDPGFEKLIELFIDTDMSRSQKIRKLTVILRTLVQKQKELGLHCLERTNLEKMTLKTLKLICGIVYKRISRVNSKRNVLKPHEFQSQYEQIVQPVQKMLLCQKPDIVSTLFDLLNHPNYDITFQVLSCFNVLLYPGNHEAQQKMAVFIKQHDQSLILCISQLLKRAQSDLAKAKKAMRTTQNRKKSLVLSMKQASTLFMPSVVHDSSSLTSDVVETVTDIHSVDYRITMALDFLIWLCDGQKRDMQDALSGHRLFSGSNIVCQVAFLLLGIVENFNETTRVRIAQKAVQALIEMCAGNHKNQLIAFKGQVISSVNVILDSTTCEAKEIQQLKSSSMELLEVLLEEIDDKSIKLAGWIMKQLNLSLILKGMLHSWQLQTKGIFVDQTRNSLFRAYHALRRIACYKGITVNQLVEYEETTKGVPTKFAKLFKDNTNDAKKMWQHCEKWSTSVEIVYKTQNDKQILTRAFFPYDPHTHLGEYHKNTLLLHIKRNTPQEKLFDLLKWAEDIKAIKNHKKSLTRHFWAGWFFGLSTTRHYVLFWVTILLNLIILLTLKAPADTDGSGFTRGVCGNNKIYNDTCNSTSPLYFQPILSPNVPVWYYPVLYTLGSIHLILSLWMVIQYFIKNTINIRFDILLITQMKYNFTKGMFRRKALYQIVNKVYEQIFHKPIEKKRPKPEEHFQIFFFSFQPIYRILFFLFSVAGFATHGYFYCGCMIYPFLTNNVMLYIVRALKKSAFQLITVFLLCLVFVYIYAVISFALLQNYFSETKDEFCNTLFECFVTVTRLGLLTTLGLALDIRPSNDYQPNFTLLTMRAFYDIIFYIVVTTLGLNIVIAILVDSFSDMREEKDKVDEDNKTKCLICNIKKDEFERQNQSFQKHHDEDHNVWNYIHFILYLDTLHKNDYIAVEKYVSCQVANGSTSFFPLLQAKALPEFRQE